MKIEIFDTCKEVKPQPVRLRLVGYGKNSVMLTAVRPDGVSMPCGNLLRIEADGTITRCKGVNPDFGFQLDSRNRIVTQAE